MDNEMTSTKNITREIQNVLLDMLSWFHGFCVENGIRYYIIGGTLLGAMRHQGFIPWDDDVDVGVPRSDFEKLSEIMKKESGRYAFEGPDSPSREFIYPFGKLYDTSTVLVDNKKIPVRRGVFIDVFPLDGVGNSETDIDKRFHRYSPLYNFFTARTVAPRKGRNPLKNLAVYAVKAIPQFLLPDKKLLEILCSECRKVPFDGAGFVANFVGIYGKKEAVPAEWFGTPVEYRFENIVVNGVARPDEYLTRIYGNWRELPPAEKRVSHHMFDNVEINR